MNSKSISFILLLSLGTIGIFGSLAIVSFEHNGSYTCPFSVFLGAECPPLDNVMASTNHHISGLQLITNFIIGSSLNSLVFFGLLLVFFALLKLLSLISPAGFSLYLKLFAIKDLIFELKRKLFSWLSLRNKTYLLAHLRVHEKTAFL